MRPEDENAVPFEWAVTPAVNLVLVSAASLSLALTLPVLVGESAAVQPVSSIEVDAVSVAL